MSHMESFFLGEKYYQGKKEMLKMPVSTFFTYFTYVDCCRVIVLVFYKRTVFHSLSSRGLQVFQKPAKRMYLWWEFYCSSL